MWVLMSCWTASLWRGVHGPSRLVLLQVEFTMSEKTILADLLQLNLHKFEEEVRGIVDKASKEAGMEKVNGAQLLHCFAETPVPMGPWLSRVYAPVPGAGVHREHTELVEPTPGAGTPLSSCFPTGAWPSTTAAGSSSCPTRRC